MALPLVPGDHWLRRLGVTAEPLVNVCFRFAGAATFRRWTCAWAGRGAAATTRKGVSACRGEEGANMRRTFTPPCALVLRLPPPPLLSALAGVN